MSTERYYLCTANTAHHGIRQEVVKAADGAQAEQMFAAAMITEVYLSLSPLHVQYCPSAERVAGGERTDDLVNLAQDELLQVRAGALWFAGTWDCGTEEPTLYG